MKFAEFNKRFLKMDLYPHQEMALDGTFDFSGISAQVHSRNYMKSFIMNIQIAKAVFEGEKVTILCSTEDSAKRTFDDIGDFFKMINKMVNNND